MTQLRTLSRYTHEIGTPTAFFVFSLLIITLLLIAGNIEMGTLFVVALVLTTSIAGILKITFRVCRPVDASYELESFAFPSGHAAGAWFLAFMGAYLLYPFSPFWLWALVLGLSMVLAALVSVSRVVLRVHTTFQVLIGITIGIFTPLLVVLYADPILALIARVAW